MEQINDVLREVGGGQRTGGEKERGRERSYSIIISVLEQHGSKHGERWGRKAGWAVDRLRLYLLET